MGEHQQKEAKMHVSVCMGTNCTFRGASQLMETLRAEEGIKDHCIIEEMSCPDELCDHSRRSPVVKIDDDYVMQAKPEAILDEVYKRIRDNREP
ncbi:NAD(P)H-dependent oxidoreductase subunit E [Sediminispirochaeta smaragdinae]|uniref:Uncharacterized protein n=1 Tax=Sediminispirochaeta smaragdinae (strain DSM 11293 / JCM 15392 / SEBR 4228) TaxID=573413 RepID=E1RAK4_SEDSS|nr:NAD(P)H-dependent oxidoreductase subunit E [Sediminispirochaeta smaragdinae]ADK82372.1 hypothetical protein Spirs_3274 [Sediminispirochaeta smaragdinae DSM 11293]